MLPSTLKCLFFKFQSFLMILVWSCFKSTLLWTTLLLLCFASLTKAKGQNQPGRTIQEIIDEVSSHPISVQTAGKCLSLFRPESWGLQYGGETWKTLFLLCIASLTKAKVQNQPGRTIQEIIEEVSSQQNAPQTAREYMKIFKSQGWGVKYGGKGWLKSPQNVSVPYEIPTKKDCVPRIIDMFLCHQCNKDCILDWIALHSECPETKMRDIKEKIETLVKQGTMFSDFGQMLPKDIRSNLFGNIPATLLVEDCALKKMIITFSKGIRSEGVVFNVTTKGLNDTTIFVIDGQNPTVSKCGLLQPENEWFCERVTSDSTNGKKIESGTGGTIQDYIEAASSVPVPPQNPSAWMDHFKLKGWRVTFGGKGWMNTLHNVSERYEIPTNEFCIPRIIDMYLCRQCNDDCHLDWNALHRECRETEQRGIKDKIAKLLQQGTVSSEMRHFLPKEISSSIFKNSDATLHVKDCTLKEMIFTFWKDAKSVGIVFNVTTKATNDTTLFVINGQDPIVSKCGLMRPENEWFCQRVHADTTNDRIG